MSYSFGVTGDTKQAVLTEAIEKFNKVVTDMPIHERDREMVMSHVRNTLDHIDEPGADECVHLSISGYMSTSSSDGLQPPRVMTVSASCSASVARKHVAPAPV